MHGLCPGVGCFGYGGEDGEPRPPEGRPFPEVSGTWLKPEVVQKPRLTLP